MCAIPQLVSAPLNPIPEHFRRSHPQCEHSYGQHMYMSGSRADNQETQPTYGIKARMEPRLHWWQTSTLFHNSQQWSPEKNYLCQPSSLLYIHDIFFVLGMAVSRAKNIAVDCWLGFSPKVQWGWTKKLVGVGHCFHACKKRWGKQEPCALKGWRMSHLRMGHVIFWHYPRKTKKYINSKSTTRPVLWQINA